MANSKPGFRLEGVLYRGKGLAQTDVDRDRYFRNPWENTIYFQGSRIVPYLWLVFSWYKKPWSSWGSPLAGTTTSTEFMQLGKPEISDEWMPRTIRGYRSILAVEHGSSQKPHISQVHIGQLWAVNIHYYGATSGIWTGHREDFNDLPGLRMSTTFSTAAGMQLWSGGAVPSAKIDTI